jgi:hypothetical protein
LVAGAKVQPFTDSMADWSKAGSRLRLTTVLREDGGPGGGGRLGILGLRFVEDLRRFDAGFADLVDLAILLGGKGV